MNVAQASLENLERYGEYSFLLFQEKAFTNKELNKKANQFAHHLMNSGIAEDDRVIVILPNLPDVLVSYQAILKIGAIIVPINLSLSESEIQYIVENCEPKMVITDSENEQKIKRSIKSIKNKPIIQLVDAPSHEQSVLEDLDLKIKQKDKHDVAAIIYTSGTTGKPKGAMITHDNLSAVKMELQALGLLNSDGTRPIDNQTTMLVSLPISHIYGLTVTMMAYTLGAKIVLMPRFDLEKTFQMIQNEKINLFAGVPTMYLWMAQFAEAKNYDVSSVKYWISGAAPLPEDVRNRFEQTFNTKIIEGYGLTESTASFALQRLERPIKPNSVGQLIPDAEIKVFDEHGRALDIGEIGELAIKGRNVMKGYFRMEEETKKVLKDGWLMTGDVGYIDEDGDIFIVERKKDLIIRGGFNIYPREVEEVLIQHPAVLEAGVIGVPNQDLGEVVKAFVTLNPGQTVDKKTLLQYCEQNLAKYKVPEYIDFVDELPKNDLGKVLRRELKKLN